ncbi:LVIVD repeat-containing protein [candidate division KSB1 bacterium]
MKLRKILIICAFLHFLVFFPACKNTVSQEKNNDDIQSTEVFQKIAECTTSVLGNYIDIEGNSAYVSTQNGFMVFDITDPENPANIGRLDFGSAFEIEVYGDHAYLQAGSIKIIDISQRGNYRIDNQYGLQTGYARIKAKNGYLFVSVIDKGLEILDISDPASPQKIGQFYEPGSYAESWMGYVKFDIKDNIIYLGEANIGFKIINISDKQNPVKISSVPVTSLITDIYIKENLLFVGTTEELIIYDISNPEIPVKISNLTSYNPAQLTASGNTLIFYDDNKSYSYIAVDISDPASPQVLGTYSTYSHDIHYDGTYLFGILDKFMVLKVNR